MTNFSFIDIAAYRGGAEISLEMVLKNTKQEIELITTPYSGIDVKGLDNVKLISLNIHHSYLKQNKNIFLTAPVIIKIFFTVFFLEKKNIILTNTFKSHIMGFFMKITGRCRRWIIIERDYPENMVVKILKLILYSFSCKVIFNSSFLLNRYGLRKKGIVINNLFNIPEKKCEKNGRIFIFAGDISYQKGLDRALQIFRLIRARLSDVEFHIFGNRPIYGGGLIIKDKRGVFQHGYGDVFDYYKLSTFAFLLNRRKESFSRFIFEAMSYGNIPVILSGNGMDDYAINNQNALVFNNFDEKKIAERIISLIETENYRSMCENAFSDLKEKYNSMNPAVLWNKVLK